MSIAVRNLSLGNIHTGSNPATYELPSTSGVHPSIPLCSMLQGRQAQGFQIGVRCLAHNPSPPAVSGQSVVHSARTAGEGSYLPFASPKLDWDVVLCVAPGRFSVAACAFVGVTREATRARPWFKCAGSGNEFASGKGHCAGSRVTRPLPLPPPRRSSAVLHPQRLAPHLPKGCLRHDPTP